MPAPFFYKLCVSVWDDHVVHVYFIKYELRLHVSLHLVGTGALLYRAHRPLRTSHTQTRNGSFDFSLKIMLKMRVTKNLYSRYSFTALFRPHALELTATRAQALYYRTTYTKA